MRPLFFFVFLISTQALAYPELVRHGYANCISCHVSPTGGGVLTEYGRALSKEVLSIGGPEGSERFVGFFSTPQWLNVGGDVRFMQFYRDNPQVQETKFFPMQMDVEAAASVNLTKTKSEDEVPQRLIIDATYGLQGGPTPADRNRMVSRRHFLNYRPTEDWSVRAGRFLPAYGINTDNHVLVTKRGLGWDQGRETYNLELAWLGADWNIYGTGIFGRPDAPELFREKGGSLSAGYFFGDGYKVGGSYYYGDNERITRHIAGPWGILGITPYFFILAEASQVWSFEDNVTPPIRGFVDSIKVDYEVIQGLHFFVTQEYSQLDLSSGFSRIEVYGFGTQIFPMPHFDILATWQRQRNLSLFDLYTDFAYLMLHIYL